MPHWLTIVLTAIVTALASSFVGYLLWRAQAAHQRKLKREDVDADRRREAHVGIYGACARIGAVVATLPYLKKDNRETASDGINEMVIQVGEFSIDADEDVRQQATNVMLALCKLAHVLRHFGRDAFTANAYISSEELEKLQVLVKSRVRGVD